MWFDIDPITREWWIRCNVMGDEGDAFNLNYNEIISPWSNPSTTKYINGSPSLTNISFRVYSQTGDSITIKVYKTYQHALELPPSKPQHLTTAYDSLNRVVLNWCPNQEPNLMSYIIYRAFGDNTGPGTFSFIGGVNDTAHTFIDNNLFISADTNKRVFYKILAKNDEDEYSVYSDFDWVKFHPCTVSQNKTFSGTIHVEDSLVVQAGKILTIQPGSKFLTQAYADITVYGTLTAEGSSTDTISFESADSFYCWGALIFTGSGAENSHLNYIHFKNGTEVRCLNNSDITLENSLFEGMESGIYIYESQPNIYKNSIIDPVNEGIYGNATGLAPLIYDNIIMKTENSETYNEGIGIYLINYIYPNVVHNDISGFDAGMYYGGGSYTFFCKPGNTPFGANNRFTNNNTNLLVGWGGTLDGGADTASGKNTFHNQEIVDVYAYNEAWVMVNGNYWDGDTVGNFYCDQSSYIEAADPLFTDPWGSSKSNQYVVSSRINAENEKTGDLRKGYLRRAQLFENQGRIREAITVYKEMIQNDIIPKIALTSLAKIAVKYHQDDLLTYISGFASSTVHNGMTLRGNKLLGGISAQRGEYDNAIRYFDNVITMASTDYEGINARFDKFFVILNVKKDIAAATRILNEIKSLNFSDKELVYRISVAERMLNGGKAMQKNPSKKNTSTTSAVIEYALDQNYPNPFNPTTTIFYQIPKNGFVSLIVYDALGREVQTLVNEEKAQGKYSVEFKASNLPSGVYFYTLRSGDFSATKKLLLVK